LILFFGLDLNFETMVKNNHETLAIRNWKKRGLILKEGQTYKQIYSYVMTIKRCERCGINFDDEIHNNKRCMDHNHKTGFFRQVLCMKCNKGVDSNKIGFSWIHPHIDKRDGKVYVYFRYQRTGFKNKKSSSLTKLIAYSFINILKVPV
jgi:hypothetical protein